MTTIATRASNLYAVLANEGRDDALCSIEGILQEWDAAVARADKAERGKMEAEGRYERTHSALVAAHQRRDECAAHVVALMGAIEAMDCEYRQTDDDQVHAEPCPRCTALSLSVPELAQAVQGLLDTLHFISSDCLPDDVNDALSALDSAMGRKP